MIYSLRGVEIMDYMYEKNRIYVNDDQGKLIVEATFPLFKEGIVVIDHTYVDPSLRGHGVASDLMNATCAYIKEIGLKMVATCPYAVVWFKRHHAYDDILDLEEQTKLSPQCQI
jgi:predicted GNAT family acetyltransferase